MSLTSEPVSVLITSHVETRSMADHSTDGGCGKLLQRGKLWPKQFLTRILAVFPAAEWQRWKTKNLVGSSKSCKVANLKTELFTKTRRSAWLLLFNWAFDNL